ncbi:MAG: peptidase M16 [Proteobacteria bacterium]|nr:MAG: peptidase M16 [Pseudomonadota bacterium]
MSEVLIHPAFELIQTETIPSLRTTVYAYRHKATGATHYHLESEDPNNVFLVAFRTVPMDSTGVAHILEHTALCGSERFPVRDPFFMMTRRSLNTFMNAFTSSDWTAYPFASQNRKDFENLLAVYLDAAFFPRLDALDFAQEGHRIEFAETDNTESPLVFKGVVFNEMKGAMSSPVRALWDALSSHLFPTVTYHYNSGGDPAAIPDLTHDQLVAFHRSHYHPSNAVFMTYGDIPAVEHQTAFEEQALHRFTAADLNIHVADEQRLPAPQTVAGRYAVEPEGETRRKTHIVLGWLLDKSTDLETMLTAHLLADVLLDNSASPLRHALETSELGTAPSPLCGLEDSNREMVFTCGVEGSEPEHGQAVEELVLGVLKEVAEQGVPQELIESMLHQLELHQREIGGDGFPYGLQMMLNALPAAIHRGNPATYLNIDPVLESLRQRIQNPGFIKELVRTWLLDNPHRVTLTFRPDPNLGAEQAQAETERLAAIKAGLDADARQQIIEQAHALEARQNTKDDPAVLPKVGLGDIPRELKIPEPIHVARTPLINTWFNAGTNGLVYEQLIVDLPPVDETLLPMLPLFTAYLSEVGSGGRDYRATQARHAAVTGGIHANLSVHGGVEDIAAGRAFFVLSGKSLNRNQGALGELLQETFETARFDELSRLRELVAQSRAHAEQSVTDNGHMLAMTGASSGMSPVAALAHQWRGLEGIRRLKALDDALNSPAELQHFAASLETLRQSLQSAPRQFLLVAEAEQHQVLHEHLSSLWTGRSQDTTPGSFQPAFTPKRVSDAWTTSTSVNFCGRAYPAVPPGHADAAPLTVLGGYLRNNFLHRAIREQGGAYGGGASYDSDSGSFRFYSYRDPRLGATLRDFDSAIEWLLTDQHEPRYLEEAILGVIARIDQPGSPAGEAKSAFHSSLHGRTPAQRREFRGGIVEVTLDDLRRVASRYLKDTEAHTTVICPPTAKEEIERLALTNHKL